MNMRRFEQRRVGYLLGAACGLFVGLTVGTLTAANGVCVGDCDKNGDVIISEVQKCVNVRTSDLQLSGCTSADQNLDGTVDDNEVGLCVQSFLDPATCPQVFTPVPTSTRTDTATPVPSATPTL